MAGLPQSFQILDMQDQLAAVKRAAQGDERRRGPLPAARRAVLHHRPQGRGPARRATSRSPTSTTRRHAELYAAYDEQCQREGVVDFAELLLRSYELLRDNEPLREHYQRALPPHPGRRVPGHQPLQYHWLKLLAGPQQRALFAVGDDDQSIYAFRGANVGNMADVRARLPRARR